MYPRVKYGLADGHYNEAADATETPAMRESEAGRPAAAAAEAADQASPEDAAAASAHAVAVSA